jgi:hypothetical protein
MCPGLPLVLSSRILSCRSRPTHETITLHGLGEERGMQRWEGSRRGVLDAQGDGDCPTPMIEKFLEGIRPRGAPWRPHPVGSKQEVISVRPGVCEAWQVLLSEARATNALALTPILCPLTCWYDLCSGREQAPAHAKAACPGLVV